MNFFFNLYQYFYILLNNKTPTKKLKFQFYRYIPFDSLNKHLHVWNSANKPTQSPQKFALLLCTVQFSIAVNFSFRVNIFLNTNVIFLKLIFRYLCLSKFKLSFYF